MEDRNKIIVDNLKLADYAIRKAHCNYRDKEEYEEYYQIAVLGMIKGMKKHDKTISTTNYLMACARNELIRHFKNKTLLKNYVEKGNISANIKINDDIELIDTIPNNVNIERDYIIEETKERIKKCVNKLKDTTYKISFIEYYYNELNTTEIAHKYNVSKQKIQQDIQIALKHLKPILLKEFKNERQIFED